MRTLTENGRYTIIYLICAEYKKAVKHMNKSYEIKIKENSVELLRGSSLSLPTAVRLNGNKLSLALCAQGEDFAVYKNGKNELRFEFFADCVKVAFSCSFDAPTPIESFSLFSGGVDLAGFDRAFTVQPRNNAGKNMDYFNHLPDASANGYYMPALLNLLIGSAKSWVGFGLLDLPDSKLYRMEEDHSILVEAPGGNKVASAYVAPEMLITFAKDEWDGISVFREKLIEFNRYTPTRPKYSEVPAWWKDPFMCTYGDQLLEDRVGQGIDDNWVSEFVDIAERDYGIEHMNLIIDDSWQLPHAFDAANDTKRFPDMRDFCERMHQRGHHVILWCTPMFDKITNGFETRAQKHGVLSEFLHTLPYFNDFPGCYAVDYTADNARAFLREICEILFGAGEGQWNADGVKLDFMGRLRDPAETKTYAHPERGVGIKELYAFYEMFAEEARRVKPDVILDCTTGDPRFENFITHNRLHDTHCGVEEKEIRAKLAALACPDMLIDSDGALMYSEWMRNHYVSAAVYSVPSYYYIKKLHDFASFNGIRLYTEEEAAQKQLLPREKKAFGTLFSMAKLRPDGHAVMDDFGAWRIVDHNGETVAVSQRGDTVIYYPTKDNPTGYIFTFRNETQILPLYGHKLSGLTPTAEKDQLLVDYARDRFIVRLAPGVLYTFQGEDDAGSIDRIFAGEKTGDAVETEMNYVN